MANVRAPFGFADAYRLGAAVNYQMSRRWISPANPSPIYKGDPFVQLNTGYIAQASTPTAKIGGIFLGCEYWSVSQQKWIANPMWPGSDAQPSLGVAARVIDDPMMVFKVQANGLATLAMIGMNATFDITTVGGGTVIPKISGAMLDMVTNAPAFPAAGNATWPFRIVDLVQDPPGSQGADTTTPYNYVYVAFNDQDFKTTGT